MISPIGPSKVASQIAMPNSNINDYRDVSFTDVKKLDMCMTINTWEQSHFTEKS